MMSNGTVVGMAPAPNTLIYFNNGSNPDNKILHNMYAGSARLLMDPSPRGPGMSSADFSEEDKYSERPAILLLDSDSSRSNANLRDITEDGERRQGTRENGLIVPAMLGDNSRAFSEPPEVSNQMDTSNDLVFVQSISLDSDMPRANAALPEESQKEAEIALEEEKKEAVGVQDNNQTPAISIDLGSQISSEEECEVDPSNESQGNFSVKRHHEQEDPNHSFQSLDQPQNRA